MVTRCTPWVCLVLLAGIALCGPPAAEADVFRKRMGRRLPQNWFPFPQNRIDLTFRATGPNATFTFTTDKLFQVTSPLMIDNVAVVEREYFRDNDALGGAMSPLRCDSRVPGFSDGNAVAGEYYLEFPEPPLPSGIRFLDTFAEDPRLPPEDPRWDGVDGEDVGRDHMNGVFWKTDLDTFPRFGELPRPCHAIDDYSALSFRTTEEASEQHSASFSIDNLEAGKTYILTGWWGIDKDFGANFIVEIAGDIQAQPPILLVDDDDDAPDVLPAFTEILDELGLLYDVCGVDQGFPNGCRDDGSSGEPDKARLARYSTVVWFSGDKCCGATPAGPTAEGEAALAGFLDNGGCLLMDSEEYLWDRGGNGSDIPTDFMISHLAVAGSRLVECAAPPGTFCTWDCTDPTGGADCAASCSKLPDSPCSDSDVFQSVVTGVLPSFFEGLGPDFLSPITFSDRLVGGSLAVSGDQGEAAIANLVSYDYLTPGYRTVYFGFGLENMDNSAFNDRLETVAAALKVCDLTCPLSFPFHLGFSVNDPPENIAADQIACNSLVTEGSFAVSGDLTLWGGNFVTLGDGFSADYTVGPGRLAIGTGSVEEGFPEVECGPCAGAEGGGYICDDPVIPWCDEVLSCLCVNALDQQFGNFTACVDASGCGSPCVDAVDCPTDQVCAADTCCGEPVCMPLGCPVVQVCEPPAGPSTPPHEVGEPPVRRPGSPVAVTPRSAR